MVLCKFLKHEAFFFFSSSSFLSLRKWRDGFKPAERATRDTREGGREDETKYCEREGKQRTGESVLVQSKQSLLCVTSINNVNVTKLLC